MTMIKGNEVKTFREIKQTSKNMFIDAFCVRYGTGVKEVKKKVNKKIRPTSKACRLGFC